MTTAVFILRRLRPWWRVVCLEFPTWSGKVRTMAAQATALLGAARRGTLVHPEYPRYLDRLAACQRCPIWDRSLKRCRPSQGHRFGCGCYTPFLALLPEPCWGRKAFPNEPDVGWD